MKTPRAIALAAALAAMAFIMILYAGVYALAANRYAAADHPGWETTIARALAAKYGAQVEVRLPDGTRVDLLTDEEAIEVDWAKKWAEAIGQALYYADATKRRPAVILLLTAPTDQRYVDRCQRIAKRYGIRVYTEPVKCHPN
jgi:hypothetical protein